MTGVAQSFKHNAQQNRSDIQIEPVQMTINEGWVKVRRRTEGRWDYLFVQCGCWLRLIRRRYNFFLSIVLLIVIIVRVLVVYYEFL